MDKNELPYFTVGENGYGGAQGWFTDKWMNIGGCAAVTACDSSIYFDLYRGTRLYPKDMNNITREDYIDFGRYISTVSRISFLTGEKTSFIWPPLTGRSRTGQRGVW